MSLGDVGGHMGPDRAASNVKLLLRCVGHPDIACHSMHHFHATVLPQTGENIVVVSRWLGHANVSIASNIRPHVLPAWQKEAADSFPDVMAEACDDGAAA